MDDGNGEIKICQSCGESVYLFNEEDVKICPGCGSAVSYFQGGD